MIRIGENEKMDKDHTFLLTPTWKSQRERATTTAFAASTAFQKFPQSRGTRRDDFIRFAKVTRHRKILSGHSDRATPPRQRRDVSTSIARLSAFYADISKHSIAPPPRWPK